ncbi:hypothetical protein [uncultured Sphingomonas sp.]|uniref:hypothetical protein n=1 Tax=uncultured Sphingomonas sp. TaxID=158754 RepID=UPI00374A4BDA
MVYLWRTVDHEGEILESYISKNPRQSRVERAVRVRLTAPSTSKRVRSPPTERYDPFTNGRRQIANCRFTDA